MEFTLPERGLIIRQPWIGMILRGEKHWEMRSKPTKIRGRIALIEAGTGLIVGEANLTGSPTYSIGHIMHEYSRHRVDDALLLEKWRFPWVMHLVQCYNEPIPYKHPKGAVIWVNLEERQQLKRSRL